MKKEDRLKELEKQIKNNGKGTCIMLNENKCLGCSDSVKPCEHGEYNKEVKIFLKNKLDELESN